MHIDRMKKQLEEIKIRDKKKVNESINQRLEKLKRDAEKNLVNRTLNASFEVFLLQNGREVTAWR